MKNIFLLSILIFVLNAGELSRFVDVKEYKKFSYENKKYYLSGSVDMLWVQLINRFGKDNKISICLKNVSKTSDFIDIYDKFLDKSGNQYNDYSASEILTLAIVEHCKY